MCGRCGFSDVDLNSLENLKKKKILFWSSRLPCVLFLLSKVYGLQNTTFISGFALSKLYTPVLTALYPDLLPLANGLPICCINRKKLRTPEMGGYFVAIGISPCQFSSTALSTFNWMPTFWMAFRVGSLLGQCIPLKPRHPFCCLFVTSFQFSVFSFQFCFASSLFRFFAAFVLLVRSLHVPQEEAVSKSVDRPDRLSISFIRPQKHWEKYL